MAKRYYISGLSIVLCLAFAGSQVLAQQDTCRMPLADSLDMAPLSPWKKHQHRTDKVISSKAFQMTYIGVPLIIGGLIVKNEDDHFHDLRNSYIPTFRNHYDDYLQYAPAVAMLAMKAGGVEGRSSWGRMLVSDAFSAGLMALTVNSLKNTIHVKRPDGSARNSFPSGHTATAFMTATMLHKEYGLTRSPWYSIGAYSVATATAVSRMMNNKHWLSDVMVGAGVGILSTEVGYFLADLIFRERGLTHKNLDFDASDLKKNPSFFGIYMGFSLMPDHYNLTPTIHLKASPGSTAGFEGAWFMNRYLGFGGRIAATSMPISLTRPLSESLPPDIAQKVGSFQSDPFDMIAGYVGPYFSFPVTDRFLVGSKLLAGCVYVPKNGLSALYKDKDDQKIKEWHIFDMNHSFNTTYSTNLSFTYILKQNLGVRVFFDYNISPSRFTTSTTRTDDALLFEQHQVLQYYTLGAAVNVMLW